MSAIKTIANFLGFGKPPVTVVNPPSPGVTNPPANWNTSTYLPPGRPMLPVATMNQPDVEPRSFDFPPMVNTSITPRSGYALISFPDIYSLVHSTPEPQIFIGMIKREMSILIPQLKDAKGEVVDDSPFNWMVTKPDGQNEWSTWLSQWLDSILMYDAGALYKEKMGGFAYKVEGTGAKRINNIRGLKKGEDVYVNHVGGKTVHLRVVDGSTIFPVIDQNGNLPQSPFPAFVQVIKGTPYEWLTRDQLWYQPRFIRSNAPYGKAPIEECSGAIEVLSNYWSWVAAWYTNGTRAEDYMKAPPGWEIDQILQWQEARAILLAGNPIARQQMQYLPDGFAPLASGNSTTGVAQAREGDYKRAYEKVAQAFGITPSERGDAPDNGFGGKSWHEGGTDVFSRQVMLSLMKYCSNPFNEILRDEYKIPKDDLSFELSFPAATIRPEEERKQTLELWKERLITRNAALQNLSLPPSDGPDGDEYWEPTSTNPTQSMGEEAQGFNLGGYQNANTNGNNGNGQNGNGNGKVKIIKAKQNKLELLLGKVTKPRPKRLTKAQRQFFKHCGVCPEDDIYFGAPVSREVKIPYPEFTSNKLEIVSMTDEDLGARAAIWRGENGESEEQRAIVGGALYPRDEAVYLLDRVMELHLVPVAYVTDLDGEMGVIVHYVKGNEGAKSIEDYDPEWLDRAGLLDYIAGQMDRHEGNWLTHPDDDGRPILIDNAMSFGGAINSPFAGYLLNKPLSDEIKDLLYLVLNHPALWDDIAGLVGDEAAEVAKQRAVALMELTETPEGEAVKKWRMITEQELLEGKVKDD
jgi:hypothetical protein